MFAAGSGPVRIATDPAHRAASDPGTGGTGTPLTRNVLLPRCTASRDAASPQRGTVLAPPSAHGRAIVAPMGPPKRRATYEDLMQVPDTKVAEIIDGELVVSPRPASPHAHAATVLGSDVTGPFHRGPGDPAGPGGWWILLEPELHLAEDVLVPDWAGWQRDRLPVFPDTPAFTQVPDWVCEVISPSTGRIDRSRKMRIYAREGVSHLWFVEPQLETLEIYRLESGRWVVVGTHAGDEAVRAEPFDAVELRLGRWWMPRNPAAQL